MFSTQTHLHSSVQNLQVVQNEQKSEEKSEEKAGTLAIYYFIQYHNFVVLLCLLD